MDPFSLKRRRYGIIVNYFEHQILPPVNEVWGKVMFSEVFVCPQGVSVQGVETPHLRQRPPPCYGKENAVRVLLECILFILTISKCVVE